MYIVQQPLPPGVLLDCPDPDSGVVYVAAHLDRAEITECVAEALAHLMGRDDLAPNVTSVPPPLRCLPGGLERADTA